MALHGSRLKKYGDYRFFFRVTNSEILQSDESRSTLSLQGVYKIGVKILVHIHFISDQDSCPLEKSSGHLSFVNENVVLHNWYE
ncbi:hypothetical protein CEXT_695211 [Caerostris extrusa]|uniref:Uncharacterized protein n=1 Tax=Caerostris extrusa TaxID=172846 RepID=A0AAV4S3Z7_CAEEX|nr:hypothetical protein CEXT_695211 [Caerostris extrusa]